MLELWRMRCIPLLLSLPGPLWLGVAAYDMVQTMSQVELNCNYAKLNSLKIIFFQLSMLNKKLYLYSTELFEIELFGYLTVCEQKKLCLYKTELLETFIKMT